MGAPTWPPCPQRSSRSSDCVYRAPTWPKPNAAPRAATFGLAPDEALDDRVRGGLDRGGRADLHDPPLVEHGHRIRDLEDFRDLVADHDGREVQPSMELEDQMVDRVDQDGIEPGRGLVEEHDRGFRRQR